MKKNSHDTQADAILRWVSFDISDPDWGRHEIAERFRTTLRAADRWRKRGEYPVYKNQKPGRKEFVYWYRWLPREKWCRYMLEQTTVHEPTCATTIALLQQHDLAELKNALELLARRRRRTALVRLLAGYGSSKHCSMDQRRTLQFWNLITMETIESAFGKPGKMLIAIRAAATQLETVNNLT